MNNIRGGSELGRDWYEAGKLSNKMNSFYDFIAVAEHLVKSNLTSPDNLAAMGTSAGGLLVGKSNGPMRYERFTELLLAGAMLHMRPGNVLYSLGYV